MPRKSKSTTKEPTDTSTPTAEAPAVQETAPVATSTPTNFAEKVGQKKSITTPDPFSIACDYLAGVRLFESRHDRQMAIRFGEGRPEDKPSAEVIGKLKGAGYHWNPLDKVWAHKVWPASAMTTRINAEKLFQDISKTIREEKGIDPGQEIPF